MLRNTQIAGIKVEINITWRAVFIGDAKIEQIPIDIVRTRYVVDDWFRVTAT